MRASPSTRMRKRLTLSVSVSSACGRATSATSWLASKAPGRMPTTLCCSPLTTPPYRPRCRGGGQWCGSRQRPCRHAAAGIRRRRGTTSSPRSSTIGHDVRRGRCGVPRRVHLHSHNSWRSRRRWRPLGREGPPSVRVEPGTPAAGGPRAPRPVGSLRRRPAWSRPGPSEWSRRHRVYRPVVIVLPVER